MKEIQIKTSNKSRRVPKLLLPPVPVQKLLLPPVPVQKLLYLQFQFRSCCYPQFQFRRLYFHCSPCSVHLASCENPVTDKLSIAVVTLSSSLEDFIFTVHPALCTWQAVKVQLLTNSTHLLFDVASVNRYTGERAQTSSGTGVWLPRSTQVLSTWHTGLQGRPWNHSVPGGAFHGIQYRCAVVDPGIVLAPGSSCQT